MSIEILKDKIQLPAQNNLTWIFHARFDKGPEVPWQVFSFDLGIWFKEAVGRYPQYERGDNNTRQDILDNWDRVEPRLKQELEKQAELKMEISVDGGRTSTGMWDAVRNLPTNELPPLTVAQREAARKMRVSDEDYARSFLAAERTRDVLLSKTERLGRFLADQLHSLRLEAVIAGITLRTLERVFEVEVQASWGRVPIRIDETVVDDLFERGLAEGEERLKRILDVNLRAGRVA